MTPGQNWIVENILDWMKVYVEYQDTAWWKFSKRRKLKLLLDWCYPVVRSQVLNVTKPITNLDERV